MEWAQTDNAQLLTVVLEDLCEAIIGVIDEDVLGNHEGASWYVIPGRSSFGCTHMQSLHLRGKALTTEQAKGAAMLALAGHLRKIGHSSDPAVAELERFTSFKGRAVWPLVQTSPVTA